MTVAEGKLQVGVSDKYLDTTTVTQADGGTTHREVVVLADPETLASYAAVLADEPDFSEIGLVTRPILPLSQFGDLRTSERTPLIELNGSYGTSAIRDAVTTANDGTVALVNGEIRLRTSATADGSALVETTEAGRYQPGYGAEGGIGIRVPTSPTGNQAASWGMRDTAQSNGLYFGVDATGVYVAVLNGGEETKTYQTSWNIDRLNGAGKSGLTLAISDGNIWQIQYTWYGYGQIMFGVVSVVGNRQRFVPVHAFKPTGAASIRSPNLTIFAYATNGGDDASLDVFLGGRQFSVAGTYNPQYRFTGQERAAIATSTTAKPMVSFRHKSGFTDRSVRVSALVVKPATEDVIVEVRIGGSLTGASYATPTNHTAAETAVEADVSATAISNGVVIWSEYFPAGEANRGLGANAALSVEVPTNQAVSLCVRTLTGTGTCASFLRLQEEW